MEKPQKEKIILPITIRAAGVEDLEAITSIYNEAVVSTTATFDTEPKTPSEQLEWFQKHDERHPLLVAELNSHVIGWASLSRWSDRRAYDGTAEISVYIKADYRGNGIGTKLLNSLIEEAKQLDVHSLIARIAQGGVGSLHLTDKFGFVKVGTLKEAGKKFGNYLDVIILQKMLH